MGRASISPRGISPLSLRSGITGDCSEAPEVIPPLGMSVTPFCG
jgi:hypothetical protein